MGLELHGSYGGHESPIIVGVLQVGRRKGLTGRNSTVLNIWNISVLPGHLSISALRCLSWIFPQTTFLEITAVKRGHLFCLADILITYSISVPPCQCVFNLIDLKVSTCFICLQDLFHLVFFFFFFNSAVIRPFDVWSFLSSSWKGKITVSNILNMRFPFILFTYHFICSSL